MKVTQGDIISRTMTFTDQATGDPYDLSIYDVIKMQVRKRPGSDVIAEGSLEDGNFEVSGADNNVFEIKNIYIPADTPAGVYLYDIEFSNVDTGESLWAPTSIKDTLVSGTITITAQITV
jgi:hypothetical protein